ncbi:class I SAM-dependent methyltransferase [Sphingobium sp. BYY-5]|uniref:O-methyltransferase n=1 Tax=Sphingobium sp. BYY-5 TaxID=2926400 RepID=UPI001FA7B7A2|nr:class I SAM-dependent methyltransferase [Sphingobium sp. BYY-5]MCI4588714.1 class I SAM-dependent methyltransferase [Sphingobium sp. BYY-5]
MTTLDSAPVSKLLDTLHRQAEISDQQHIEEMMAAIEAPGASLEQVVADLLAKEKIDYRASTRSTAGNFLAVSPAFGRFLYAIARACKATRIVEFGTSMGISAIYLAAALRDNGGGQLIGSEIEPTKVARARANLAAAGLADLVEIREGDALETLQHVGSDVDLLLIDGAFSLYLPVLKLVEPGLMPGAIILGENAFDPEYQAYVHDRVNGYLSQSLPIGEGRGNEFSVRVR